MRLIKSIVCSLSLLAGLAASPAFADLYCYQPENPGWNWETVDYIGFSACLDTGAQRSDSDIDGVGAEGMTLLELAIKNNARPSVIQLILSAGANPNLVNPQSPRGFAPLVMNFTTENTTDEDVYLRVKALLEAGANPNQMGSDGYPAFQGAFGPTGSNAMTGKMLDLILLHGADLTAPIQNGHQWTDYGLVSNADLQTLKRIQKITGDSFSNIVPYSGSSMLHDLAYSRIDDRLAKLDWLIAGGADPKVTNNQGKYAWELIRDDAELAAKLRSLAGVKDEDMLATIASDRDISLACRTPQSEAMIKGDGMTIDEVCTCVEDNAATRFSRVSQHPLFPKVYGAKDQQGKVSELVRGLFIGCMAIWSYRP
ncbi:hypothetical protein LCGC14_0227620 [marine sediment metagenome]|uniref:Uncharacterized protein n=1 Tax=marine sediment metagenome TaxID=412755 RepID=A0A0F9XEY2_9ZZZZ